MKSAVETLSPTRAKMTVEVSFDELAPNLEAAYKAIAKQVNIPGFRRGKVPPAVIDRQIGRGAVLDQAINDALPKLYVQALQDNDLEPLAQPEIDVTKLEDNDSLEFTAEVDVKPEITLPSYQGIEAEVEDVEVTDDDVAEQIEALRERFGSLSDVERPAAEGDFVVIDLQATKDGEEVEGGQLSGYSYKIGSGNLLEGIDEAVTGLEAGGSADFTSQLLGGDLAGEDVDIHVTVTGVKEQNLPEVDDDFAQEASEFDTVEELREDIRTRLVRGKRLEQAAAARDAVLEKLLDQVEIPLPDEMVDSELSGRKQEMEQQLAWAGMTMEQYLDNEEQTVDEFEAELEKRVRDSVAAQFLLDAIAKKEELGVEQNELSEHLMRRAQQSGQNPDEFMRHMLEHNHIPEMVGEVLRGKALASVVESATVKDASGNVVDLKNLLPDGSIGDPDAAVEESTDETAEGADEAALEE